MTADYIGIFIGCLIAGALYTYVYTKLKTGENPSLKNSKILLLIIGFAAAQFILELIGLGTLVGIIFIGAIIFGIYLALFKKSPRQAKA